MSDLKFSIKSISALETCVMQLQILAKRTLATGLIDFAILEGHRNKKRQNELYNDEKSKAIWPLSKHNRVASEAFDAAPVINGKVSWKASHHIYLAGIMTTIGKDVLGLKIRWGGNWDENLIPITDQSFQDLAHYEIYLYDN